MKILFAIDGSTCSMQAIKSALEMKCPFGTELKVVTLTGIVDLMPGTESVQEKQSEAAQELVDRTVRQLQETHADVSVSGEVVDSYIVDGIVRYSEEWPADLIVMGSHGRTGMTDFVLGSVSRSVLSLASCAVRIVRPPADCGAREGMNVLLAIDQSEHSEHLIDHTLRLPWPAGTQFKCLSVVPSSQRDVLFDPGIEFADTLERHRDSLITTTKVWLQEAAGRINKTFGAELATTEVLVGDAREKIIESARNWPADIIMLGSHGRKGAERLFLGSVSEAVATHAPCSVEVTRVPAFRSKGVLSKA